MKMISRSITLAAIGVSLFSSPSFSQSSYTQIEIAELPQDFPSDRVSFYCGEILDKDTGESIPATLAYVPQRQAEVAIIGWNSRHLAAWNPQRRCEVVSPKFQAFYEDGRLNYLSYGENAGYPIICALLDKQETCSGENQLFQVRPGSQPEDVVLGLQGILDGKSSEVLYQSSGEQFYVSISEYLENAPALEE